VKRLEWLVLTKRGDLVGRSEPELVSRHGFCSSFSARVREPALEMMDLPRGFSAAAFEPFKESQRRFPTRRRFTLRRLVDGRLANQTIDGGEPKLPFRQACEPWAAGVGRHVEVKAAMGSERAPVAFGLHNDELDSAFLIPVRIFG